jgi:hypothetical protein
MLNDLSSERKECPLTTNKGHPLSLLFDFFIRLFTLLKDTLFNILTLIFGNQKNPPIMENPHSKTMPFKIDFEGSVDKKLPLKVFVFDHHDNLLESHLLDGTDFHLKTDDHTLQHAQIFIAPIADGIALNPQPLPPQLKAIGAYRPVLTFDAKRTIQRDLLPIPEYIWRDWYFCICRVRGQVVKPFYIPNFFGGSFTFKMPVCHARVHICRLENFIFTLKDSDIFKLRDDLLTLKQPIPKPGPVVTPRFFDFHTMETMSISSSSNSNLVQTEATTFSSAFSTTFQNQLQTNSVSALRQILADNFQEIQYYPRFCWLHRCVELTVVETDDSGYFDTRIWESCYNPNHNYYMWVEYLIDGVWQSVYSPDYCSGAFWNYACGSQVTLTVTDPRVPFGCRPTQTGSFFEVVSIGAGAIVSNIHQKGAGGILTDDTGLIDMGFGDGSTLNNKNMSPFGGSLSIKVNTGSGFPSTNATHYRCIYKKSTDADVPASWTSVNNGSYFRYYTEEVNVTPTNVQAFTRGYDLHEKGTDFYKLTHENVQDDLGVPVAPIVSRVWASDVYDAATLYTTALISTPTGNMPFEDGYYDVRIEIYKKNTATNTYSLTTVAKDVFKVPNPSNYAASMDAPDSLLTTTTQSGVTSPVFQMTIRVDNGKCAAAIDNASVFVDKQTRTSDTACGMLNYGNLANVPLTVGFHAQHPNNFAYFSFGVTKGNAGGVLTTSGHLTDTPTGFTNTDNDGAPHNHHLVSVGLSAADFLGNCNGAAFAENIYVTALATDGSNRLSGYDAANTAAFAMIP